MRKGLSAVYGFIVIYLLIMAGLSAISNDASSQASLDQSINRAKQVDALRSSEHLDVRYFNGSLNVVNDGSVVSGLQDIVSRTSSGTSMMSAAYQLPVGGNVTLPGPSGAQAAGVLTSLGNLFWAADGGGSFQGDCTNGTSELTAQVSPVGSGSVTPPGVSLVCQGQSVLLDAKASPGYGFSRWVGSGSGAYNGPGNPVNIVPDGDVSETAEFVPAFTQMEVSPASDGIASGGPSRQAELVVAGPAQVANVSAYDAPPGVSISFSPDSLQVSPSGASSTMSVSFTGSGYGLYSIQILATGADGQVANATYSLQTTPPNGNIIAVGHALVPGGIGYPREHKAAYWKGTYFAAFSEHTESGTSDTYIPLYYDGGWVSGEAGSLGVDPFFGYEFDLSQSSNQVLKAAVSNDGAELCYNLGVIGGESINWGYNGVGCEGPQTPTVYDVVGFASSLIDRQGNWWAAVETQDPQHGYHFEVLAATNGGWGDVYVSPSFGSSAQPVPQLTELGDGAIAVVFTTLTAQASCYEGDYVIWTADGGYSWSQTAGPFAIGGSPLCYDRSSAASLGDRVLAGGVDSSGNLGYWSYDLDSGASYSETLVSGAAYGAMGSSGNVLTLAYSTTANCEGQESLHLMWSYNGGADWSDSGVIGCVHDYILLPAGFQTFQILIISDQETSGGLAPDFVFYSV